MSTVDGGNFLKEVVLFLTGKGKPEGKKPNI